MTADSAGQRALSAYKAHTVAADEASQLHVSQIINATARHAVRRQRPLNKVALFGDHMQLGPHSSSSGMNEFDEMTRQSYMEWKVVDAQDPVQLLGTQYRSDPEIADFVSSQFYERGGNQCSRSLATPSLGGCLAGICQKLLCFKSDRHNFFLNVDSDRQLWRRRDDPSLVNPATAAIVMRLLSAMSKQNSINIFKDVCVISFYSAQTNLLSDMMAIGFTGGIINLRTVDTAQADQKKIVIIDFVRVGREIGLLSEARRLCVAFSRAEYGMIGVGYADIIRSASQTAS